MSERESIEQALSHVDKRHDEIAERIQKAKEEVFMEALTIVRDAQFFRDVYDPGKGALDEASPEAITAVAAWTSELGTTAKAKRRLKAAQAACQSTKDAPVGLAMSTRILTAMVKADALSQMAPRELNMTFVKIGVERREYEQIEDRSEDRLIDGG